MPEMSNKINYFSSNTLTEIKPCYILTIITANVFYTLMFTIIYEITTPPAIYGKPLKSLTLFPRECRN